MEKGSDIHLIKNEINQMIDVYTHTYLQSHKICNILLSCSVPQASQLWVILTWEVLGLLPEEGISV